MTASAWHQFVFIMGLGLVVAGLTTYIIAWMLVAVHLREHHPTERSRLGGFLFAPAALFWYLAARYLPLRDRGLNGLAVLGSIGAWAIVLGAASASIAKWLAAAGGEA
jgi:hypothetical protein